jgi:hypothetical protein
MHRAVLLVVRVSRYHAQRAGLTSDEVVERGRCGVVGGEVDDQALVVG